MMKSPLVKAFVGVLFGLVIGGSCGIAGDVDADFRAANVLYKQGKYDQAISGYESLVKNAPSAAVFYNLANAYYRSGKVGLAILNYERGRRLTPRDKDLLANLEYVERSVEFEVKDKRNWYLRQMSSVLEWFTTDECLALALGGYLLFIGWLLIELTQGKHPLFGRVTVVALAFAVFCFLPFMLKNTVLGSKGAAVVVEPQVEVRYGPSSQDRLAFRLVEGLEVNVKAELGDWCRIELTDNQTGWLPKSKIVRV